MKVVVAGITTFCVLGVIAVALRWLVARSRAKIVLDPTCVRCGYITAGLPGSICPECGADLSRAGAVLRPRAVRPMGLWQLMVGGSMVFGLGLMAIEWGWLGRADGVWAIKGKTTWTGPRSDVYRSVSAEVAGEAYRRSALRGRGVLTLRLQDDRVGRSKLVWDPVRNKCRITDAESSGPERAFDRNAVLAWMRDNGIDTSHARVPTEAQEIADATSAYFNKQIGYPIGSFGPGSQSGGSQWRPTRAVQAARGMLWLGWVAGLVWLWRRSRRAWRVAVIRRVGEVETGMAQVDDWDGASLRNFD